MAFERESFPKQPREKYPINLNFAESATRAGLEEGETIASYTVKAWNGATEVTSTIIDNVQVFGQLLQVWVKGGADKTRYKISATITSNLGKDFDLDVDMNVKEL